MAPTGPPPGFTRLLRLSSGQRKLLAAGAAILAPWAGSGFLPRLGDGWLATLIAIVLIALPIAVVATVLSTNGLSDDGLRRASPAIQRLAVVTMVAGAVSPALFAAVLVPPAWIATGVNSLAYGAGIGVGLIVLLGAILGLLRR